MGVNTYFLREFNKRLRLRKMEISSPLFFWANNFHISSFKFEQFNLKMHINLILKNNWIVFHRQIKFSLKYKFFTSCHLLFLSFVMDQLTYDNLLVFVKIFLNFSWWFPFVNQSKTAILFSLDHSFVDFTTWCGARSCGNINVSSMNEKKKWSRAAVLIDLFRNHIFPILCQQAYNLQTEGIWHFFSPTHLAVSLVWFSQDVALPRKQSFDSSVKQTQFH